MSITTAKLVAKAAEEGGAETDECCANCGIAGVDDIKLEECDDCDLVKYCSDKCQNNDREQHEEECKKRRAELHERELFEQPEESHLGECPICFLPMSLDPNKLTFCSGCCKLVCMGCVYADMISSGNTNCPFCREPAVDDEEENYKRVMERVKVNDPAALQQMGGRHCLDGDYDTAVEYLKKAAELGDMDAHYRLATMYYDGRGVEEDEEKAVYHYEKAAIGGHPQARHNLACHEADNGNVKRAVKHFIIAANLGDDEALESVKKGFMKGCVSKEDYEAALRGHHAAVDETKSEQRAAASASQMYL